MSSKAILTIENLRVDVGDKPVVEDISLSIAPGEMLGLVGESGCGKSVTALCIMRLLDEPPMHVRKGKIIFDGLDIFSLNLKSLEALRGNQVAMIFQEPMTSLNPVFSVGDQIGEVILLHGERDKQATKAQVIKLLERVGIPAPEAAMERFPHQLSGGQRQRVMIAMALACNPKLLIADEPTTALDVTVQAQILDLLDDLRQQNDMAVLLITHDLGVVSQYCDRVAVMYGGQIVEEATSQKLFAAPKHRYTEALLRTIPAANEPGKELPAIGGSVPLPGARPPGCTFHPRCAHALEKCSTEHPNFTGEPHQYRCWSPAQ